MRSKPCAICGKITPLKDWQNMNNDVTCSKECLSKLRSMKIKQGQSKLREGFNKPKTVYHKVCALCGKEFTSKRYNAKYCSGPHTRKCVICGKEFDLTLDRVARNTRVCSPECSHQLTAITTQDRYGFSNYSQTPEWKIHVNENKGAIEAKRKQTCLERFGAEHYSQTKEWLENFVNDPSKMEDRNSFLNDPKTYIAENFTDKPTPTMLAEKLGINTTSVLYHVHRLGIEDLIHLNVSNIEHDVIEFIKQCFEDINIIHNDREAIRPNEIDIYLPDLNVGIECNPTATHNSTINVFDSNSPAMPALYHLNKTIKCEEAGIFLFHLFGYEWTNKRSIMESMIRNLIGANVDKVYARNCYVKEVSAEDSRKFLNENHRQGYAAASVKIGLYDKKTDRLVSLITFGKMRNTIGTGKEDLSDCWELIRFCNVLNTSVVGGASKLFKYFVDSYKPSRIRSFSDRAHTRGTLYPTLGFKYVHSSEPSYVWVDSFTDVAYNRVNAQKQNIKSFLHDDSIDLKKSEKQIMEEHGFLRMYDCGTILWEWKSD